MESNILSKQTLVIGGVVGLFFSLALLIIFAQMFAQAFTVSQNPYIAGSLQPLGLSCDGLDFNGNPRNVAVYFSNNNENEMPFYTTDCTDTGIGIYLDNNYTGSLPVTVHIMQQNEQGCSGFSAQSCYLSRSNGTEFLLTYTDAVSPPAPTSVPSSPTSSSTSSSATYSTLNVVKIVINDNGGTKTIADFPLFINGMPVVSGATNTFPAPGIIYTITETGDSNYTRTFSGDCDVNGQINLNQGENRFCIVTNDDIGVPVVVLPVPPLIDVVKVPAPLSLPLGPGPVTYTYTLRNIGTVPVTNITMDGDTCSPIVFVSGDTNGDSRLDVNEVWVHRCTTTLTETHTNTVVTTGWANGLSAVDIAAATVVVGVPGLPDAGVAVVPPLIHVTKVPNPLALLAGGGMVTYTNIVTNPGTLALSNVRLTDDKCGPVKYVSGDRNRDSKLDTTERWTYACQMNLTKTTTNTIVASGEANGIVVRDFAIATVVVTTIVPTTAAPDNFIPITPVLALPNTGFILNEVIFWNIVILAGIFAVLIILYVVKEEGIA